MDRILSVIEGGFVVVIVVVSFLYIYSNMFDWKSPCYSHFYFSADAIDDF